MPRARWLVKNRWPAVEALWQRPPPPGEEARLWHIAHQPRPIALTRLSEHVKSYYKPQLPLQTIEEVLPGATTASGATSRISRPIPNS